MPESGPNRPEVERKLTFDRGKRAISFSDVVMCLRQSFFVMRGFALCLLATLVSASAEKVRFGPAQGAGVQTRPEQSIRDSIEVRSDIRAGRAEPVPVSPTVTPSAGGAPSSPQSREAEAERQNWIFRDTRSAAGVRKALGVESGDPSLPTAPERDSVALIQEYFSREKARAAGPAELLGSGGGQSGFATGGKAADTGLVTGPGALSGAGNSRSDNLFSDSSFRNTLNSENTTLRRYFRDLYVNPGVGAPTTRERGAAVPDPARSVAAPPVGSAEDATRSPSFQDFANRAAFIDSLTPSTALTPGISKPLEGNVQTPGSTTVPTVNNGKLFERRNGVIEIPSRRF